MTSSGKPDLEWSIKQGEWHSHAAQSTAAQHLLSALLDHDVVIAHDANGAPYLPEYPHLHISVSHCRTAVAVAVSKTSPVGIDIECRRKVNDSLIERVCTPDEQALIHNSNDTTMAFLQCWTRKEAVLKCRRTGIKGFSSMVNASQPSDCSVLDIETNIPDTVASLATAV